jgi:hypothetical protein
MEKSRGGGDSLASHQALAAHLLACPHPAVCTHLCNTCLQGWRVDGEECDSGASVPTVDDGVSRRSRGDSKLPTTRLKRN